MQNEMNEWSVFCCFEMISQSVTGKQLATAMNSGEGEFVDFTEPVVLEGQVERWLCEIGKMFFLFQIIHNLTFIWEKCYRTLKLAMQRNVFNVKTKEWFEVKNYRWIEISKSV